MRRPATEAMLTIAPPPRFFMCGMTAWVPLKGPRRLTAMMRSQSAACIVAIVCRVIVPAALTKTSMPPSRAAMSVARRRKAGPSATSRACPVAVMPNSAATRSAAAPSRSMPATRAPAAANPRTQAAPIPLPPPVTRTIFPAKSTAMGSPPRRATGPIYGQNSGLHQRAFRLGERGKRLIARDRRDELEIIPRVMRFARRLDLKEAHVVHHDPVGADVAVMREDVVDRRRPHHLHHRGGLVGPGVGDRLQIVHGRRIHPDLGAVRHLVDPVEKPL